MLVKKADKGQTTDFHKILKDHTTYSVMSLDNFIAQQRFYLFPFGICKFKNANAINRSCDRVRVRFWISFQQRTISIQFAVDNE